MGPTTNKPVPPRWDAGSDLPANWRPRKPPRDWRPAMGFGAAVLILVVWWRFRGFDTAPTLAPKENPSSVLHYDRGAITAPEKSAEDSSPSGMKLHEITTQDAGKPGDPVLNDEYRDINQQFYGGKLPTIPVCWEDRLAEVGPLIAEGFIEKGLWTSRDNREFILLNTSLSSDATDTRRVLCHEIVHEYMYSIGNKYEGHGPKFQAELLRLSQAGAFEGIQSAEGEKASLKTWLNGESARLQNEATQISNERRDLEQERGAVEREGAHDQKAADYNQHLSDFNTRIQNYNDAVGNFNRSVARYNLIIAYPDGLDEANAVHAKAPPEQ